MTDTASICKALGAHFHISFAGKNINILSRQLAV
jgi:hypothetical protein